MTNVADFPSGRFTWKERALVVEWGVAARPYGVHGAHVDYITGDGSFAPHDMVLVETVKGETSHMIRREAPRVWRMVCGRTQEVLGDFPTLRDALAFIRPVFADPLAGPRRPAA